MIRLKHTPHGLTEWACDSVTRVARDHNGRRTAEEKVREDDVKAADASLHRNTTMLFCASAPRKTVFITRLFARVGKARSVSMLPGAPDDGKCMCPAVGLRRRLVIATRKIGYAERERKGTRRLVGRW